MPVMPRVRTLIIQLLLKLKLHYFVHLMQRTDSLEKTWCWEGLRAGEEVDDRRWDGWMASPTQWTRVWAKTWCWEGLRQEKKGRQKMRWLDGVTDPVDTSLSKDLMLGRIEAGEEGTTEDEMTGWRHRPSGHESEQAPWNGEEQASLACCSPWGHEESDVPGGLNNRRTLILPPYDKTSVSFLNILPCAGQPSPPEERVSRLQSLKVLQLLCTQPWPCPSPGVAFLVAVIPNQILCNYSHSK